MCFIFYRRQIRIEVKGPIENEVRIIKSSAPGKYAKSPIVFRGGESKYMHASFSGSASTMASVIIATVHGGDGQVLATFDLPNSFLPYKRFVFDLQGPCSFEMIRITGCLNDISRFLKLPIPRKIKSKQPDCPDNLPYVGSLLDDACNKVNRWMDNVPSSSEISDSHLVVCTDTNQNISNGSSSSEINDSHLLLCTDSNQCICIGSCRPETNEIHLVHTPDTNLSTSLPRSLSQGTDESRYTGYSSNHTVYYDADTSSPLVSSDSPNSNVSIDRNAIDMGPVSLPSIWDTLKGLKGIMDIQAG